MNKQIILCMIGQHKWIYDFPTTFMLPSRRRTCSHCHKEDIIKHSDMSLSETINMLSQGHNPPHMTSFLNPPTITEQPNTISPFKLESLENTTCPFCHGSGRKTEEPKEDIPTKPNINNPISGLELEE